MLRSYLTRESTIMNKVGWERDKHRLSQQKTINNSRLNDTIKKPTVLR
jgi:hypothetical protein